VDSPVDPLAPLVSFGNGEEARGKTLYISSEGACTSPASSASVVFGPSAITAGYGGAGPGPLVSTDDLGSWSTSFLVPVSTSPGPYYLSAVCTAGRTNTNWYNPLMITVVEP
jgi:hypothetical protein